ncbi:MAG: permease [Candidatus Omnitrophota bacterium]
MLKTTIDYLFYSVLKLPLDSPSVEMANFFIYDSIKILLLLFSMIWVIGILRTFVSQEKIKGWLGRSKGVGNLFASIFGAITPFCSCSSIPLFISFLKAGVPLGVTFSFLITSPLVNEYLVVLMIGFFGWKIAMLYAFFGIFIGVMAGMVLGMMKLEKNLAADIFNAQYAETPAAVATYKNFKARVLFGSGEAVTIVKQLWGWVLVGVAMGAWIHNYIPQEMVNTVVSKAGILGVPAAVALGVPMYGGCAAIVPVAVVLFQKGFPLGTALSFMMAVSALSLPEAIMLRRVMNLRLVIIFFAVTTLGIIITGYLFNFLQGIIV